MFGKYLDRWHINRARSLMQSAFNASEYAQFAPNYFNLFQSDTPKWVSLASPEDFEQAYRFNPIVKAAINILATSASNGKKVLRDTATNEIVSWNEKDKIVEKLNSLLVRRPNPLQSAKEFYFQGIFYLKVFGNLYVLANMPEGFRNRIEIENINTLVNLPSQFMEVKTTGKLYRQTELSEIIEKYSLINTKPVTSYLPDEILHLNEVNISSEMPTVMGISKLEALKYPISNVQKAFEAMNTILSSRGQQGIINSKRQDAAIGHVPLQEDEKKELDEKFKKDYGLLHGQNPFLLSPVPLEYIKTIMNSKELGIYEEFSNNSILIGNEFNVPPELMKTYIQGATYENQVQSVRRLYQDTTIPMVEDFDEYWSYRINTYEYGLKIDTTWNHIPALQEAFKEKAIALNLKGRTAKDAYLENIITVNQYLQKIEEPVIEGGDVYRNEWIKTHSDVETEE